MMSNQRMSGKKIAVTFTAKVIIDRETWEQEYGMDESVSDIRDYVKYTLDDLVRVAWGQAYLADHIEANYS